MEYALRKLRLLEDAEDNQYTNEDGPNISENDEDYDPDPDSENNSDEDSKMKNYKDKKNILD